MRQSKLLSRRNCKYKTYAAQYGGHDATVNPTALAKILDNSICHYCKQFQFRDTRTLDHKIPIIRYGRHSVDNLVMACESCNSTKNFLTDEEFLKYKNNKKVLNKNIKPTIEQILKIRKTILNKLKCTNT